MKIAVYGSATGELSDEVKKKARELGRQIARSGHTLVTGACPGLPYEAVIGASEEGGECIGFSPAVNEKQHIEVLSFPVKGFSKIIYVPESYELADDPMACKKYRNITSTRFTDMAIFIKGETGSMNEFTNMYDYGKRIGVLEGSGGISDGTIQEFLKVITKKTGAEVIFDADPIALLKKMI